MKTFTFKEVLEFVKNQDNDKELNFGTTTNLDGHCGCLMTEFGRSKGLDFRYVTYAGNEFVSKHGYFVAEVTDFPEEGIFEYVYYSSRFPRITSFGKLKEVLTTKGVI